MNKHNTSVKSKQRRDKAILRLESQLSEGVKPEKIEKNGKMVTCKMQVDLSTHDKERIKKELTTLKARV